MPTNFAQFHKALGFASAAATFVFAGPLMAQEYAPAPKGADYVSELPADMRSAPRQTETSERIVGPDGVETIVRTRRIQTRAPAQSAPMHPHAPVVERDQWLEECRDRTSGLGEQEKGRVIGGLLGAIAGGFIGNRIAGRGDRLAGTLIGAGAGGLGGALLGNLIGRGKKDGAYDCESALDGYLSQYSKGPMHHSPSRIGHMGYGYMPAQNYGYGYGHPAQVVYVPIRYEQQYRVVVRETVREETYEIPGSARPAN